MGGTSLQFLPTLILLLLCMKPTIANYLGLADTHLGCKEHERQALLKIKQDLIDDSGRLSSWSSDQDCCKWSGVRCSNQTGHVIMLKLNPYPYNLNPLSNLSMALREIVELNGLISLNLSRNLLIGKIPSEIGLLRSLDALDLSKNQLCGGIPSSISLINFLSSLNLSNNNLSGKIPIGSQLNTFNATVYEGNPNLCGFPLPKKCSGEDTTQNPAVNTGSGHASIQDEEDGFVTLGFYVSVTLGFVLGFWGVVGTMVLNRSWRFSYFKFLNNFNDKLYAAGAVIMVKFQRQLQT